MSDGFLAETKCHKNQMKKVLVRNCHKSKTVLVTVGFSFLGMCL